MIAAGYTKPDGIPVYVALDMEELRYKPPVVRLCTVCKGPREATGYLCRDCKNARQRAAYHRLTVLLEPGNILAVIVAGVALYALVTTYLWGTA